MKFRVNHGQDHSITGEVSAGAWDSLPPAFAASDASGDGIDVKYAGFDGPPATGFPKFTVTSGGGHGPADAVNIARARLQAVYQAHGAWI